MSIANRLDRIEQAISEDANATNQREAPFDWAAFRADFARRLGELVRPTADTPREVVKFRTQCVTRKLNEYLGGRYSDAEIATAIDSTVDVVMAQPIGGPEIAVQPAVNSETRSRDSP